VKSPRRVVGIGQVLRDHLAVEERLSISTPQLLLSEHRRVAEPGPWVGRVDTSTVEAVGLDLWSDEDPEVASARLRERQAARLGLYGPVSAAGTVAVRVRRRSEVRSEPQRLSALG
jgi:hypothetical protein